VNEWAEQADPLLPTSDHGNRRDWLRCSLRCSASASPTHTSTTRSYCILYMYFRMTLGLLKSPSTVHYERSIRLSDNLSPRSPPSREVNVKFHTCPASQATSAAAIRGWPGNGPYDLLHLLAIYSLDVLLRVSLDSCSTYCALAILLSATEIAYNTPIAAETPVVKKYQWTVPYCS